MYKNITSDKPYYDFILPTNVQSDIESYIQEYGLEIINFEIRDDVSSEYSQVYHFYVSVHKPHTNTKYTFMGYITNNKEDYMSMTWELWKYPIMSNCISNGSLSFLINKYIL